MLNCGADITIKDHAGLTALELATYLQEKFTYRVSPVFFPDVETSIKASNCAVWKEFADILSQHGQTNERLLNSGI